ncbi:saccharopine dehydrogenase family protein [Foetidibacter luteolus]|uniref:saccharopine dehydrogenase family protein n=1 Tax=Foetidibacter luteolus TaxID=2608880 RepID=UPI00129B10E6|nr:saccharopine dehydrogenase NADP-binding domain-containing protein [Foetidibacter luteolus]
MASLSLVWRQIITDALEYYLYFACMAYNTFLLYGANGYTGEIIARYASRFNLRPVLAGRREAAIKPIADKLGFDYVIADLNNAADMEAAIAGHKVVMHAAGPYDITARPMVEACIKAGAHYIDLNGDLAVFEMLQSFNGAARQAGIMLLPGSGFDVVPTDCLAMYLKNKLPAAVELKLAFAILNSAISRGTAITTIQKLGAPGAVRQNGHIVPRPIGHKGRWVQFKTGNGKPDKNIFVITIPWGDVSTAYFTTGIPNIESYTAMPKPVWVLLKLQKAFNWLLRTGFVKRLVQKSIDKKPAGPDDAMRQKAVSLVWGQVTDAAGNQAAGWLRCPEAYELTALSSLLIVQKALNRNFRPGYQTPASAYGENLVMEIEGVERF